MKNTKHSIRTSLTALLLCFAMLLGTTFAWFTDVAVSSDNVIQAGSLDIALMKGTPNGDGTWTWVENNGEAIFDYGKWEPGYTTWAALSVMNKGTLAAKWQAQLTLDGTPSILADVIEVYSTYDHIFDPDTRPDFTDGTWTRMGTVRELLDNDGLLMSGDFIEPEHSQPIVIALHMVEDAGNEYQGLNLGANFNIKVMATQASFESDSFGDDYDADAEWPDDFKFETSTGVDQLQILNNELVNPFIIRYNDSIYAELSTGTKLAAGATEIKFSGRTADGENNLTLGEGESAKDYDIHIEGIAEDNTQPIKVYLGKLLQPGLDKTTLKLYHENDQMTRVDSVADFLTNNQFFYDAQTGEVVIYVDNFSVFTAVNTSADKWDGKSVANAFASGTGTEANPYLIKTAAQLIYFRDQVDAGNTFKGKYVKLGVDIDLAGKPFDPIGFGYYNAETNTRVFMGTFDGGNHTIYNLYENCWELDPDKEKYSTYTYSTAGAGLFASIKDATIKNLAISGAEIVFECVDMGIVVGYAQGECHFENIIVTDSNIANHNRYTGGLVGEVSYGEDNNGDGFSHTFKNITVDSTVTVSGLWGSFGCGMGGVIGGKWGNATVKMENVVSAPVMDVYNDVVSAYQWYAFRGCGMLIGHTEEPYSDGRKSGNATATFLTCENVKVYYGDWVNYHYYEFEDQDNTTGQRFPWVRAEAGEYCDAFSNIRYGVPTHNGVKVSDLTKEELKAVATDYTPITFDQLYGADRGMYGTATHDGVKVLYTNVKTIYFQNNWQWTDIKIEYWYENGDERWTNLPNGGISIDSMKYTNDGTYDIYRIELPAYVEGFKFTGNDKTTQARNETPEVLEENIIENYIYWLWYDKVEKRNEVVYNNYNGGDYDTHDIYLVGKELDDWAPSDTYRLTPSADGKTWTGTFTITKTTEVKLYNKLIVNYNSRFIAEQGASNNSNTNLAPGKYKFTYSVESNSFTFDMIERILYLDPSSDWEKDGARFAAYVWYYSGSTKHEKWYSMTKQSDGTYKVTIDSKYVNVIFCRMNGSNSTNNWNNKWNQTGDLVASDGSLFTINNGTWDGQTSGWSTK